MEGEDAEDIELARAALVSRIVAAIVHDPLAMMRLHELERMVVGDLHQLPQRRRCPGCLRMAQALYRKATGVDYQEDASDALSGHHRDVE